VRRISGAAGGVVACCFSRVDLREREREQVVAGDARMDGGGGERAVLLFSMFIDFSRAGQVPPSPPLHVGMDVCV
jgi:hypothetical protein